MIWYQTGTISVANGSTVVTGAGTAFIDNVAPGAGFISTDGRTYPVAAVNSDNQLRLEMPYQGANTVGAAYVILPTQAYDLVLARRVLELTNSFSDVRDGVGQGLFPDGTVAAPGIRFANDQDTGIARDDANSMVLVAGGVVRASANSSGFTVPSPLDAQNGALIRQGGPAGAVINVLDLYSNTGSTATTKLRFGSAANPMVSHSFFEAQTYSGDQSDLRFGTSGSERARIDSTGNLLVGDISGSCHAIRKNVAQASAVLNVGKSTTNSAIFYGVDSTDMGNAAAAAVKISYDTVTARSLNAPGTINAGGADYAEYMLKAAGCGLIAKGDVCGVDANGRLTKSWADAISFVVKSTDPSLVGGDAWANELRDKPIDPGTAPIEPIAPIAPEPLGSDTAPVERTEGESDDAFAARVIAHAAATASYQERVAQWAVFDAAMSAHPGLVAQYQSALADHQAAVAEYDVDLAEWEDELEALRVRVDRIAFSGQVPCNVTGDFAVGDYIVAAANGGGIKAIAVPEADMTLPLYMKRIGKVWAVTDDGRAWIDVQHG